MLLYNSKLLKVRRINQIIMPILEDNTAVGYLYSDVGTFKQATTLMVRFEGRLDALMSTLKITNAHKQQIDFLYERLPEPFNLLAAYLGLITDNVELEDNVERLISRLHVIGRTISFSEFITVPVAVRVNVAFTNTAFLMMEKEVEDYQVGLYESEKDESPTDVYWVSSEEVERTGKLIKVISEAFGLSSLNTAPQHTASAQPYTAPYQELGEEEDTSKQEELDLLGDFDMSEWEGYTPATIESNWDEVVNTTKEEVRSIEMPVSSTQKESTPIEDEIDELDDMLAKMAVAHSGMGGV